VDPFEILGLPRDASVADIKRAYARALRVHRPDDDPAAFQRVFDAYQLCLALEAQPEWDEEPTLDDDDDAPATQAVAEPVVGVEAAESLEPVLIVRGLVFAPETAAPTDFQPLLAELVERARTASPTALGDWLRSLDAFYPLDAKDAAAGPVVDALAAMYPPLPHATLDEILAFFNLASVNQPNPWLAQKLAYLRFANRGLQDFEALERFYRSGQAKPVDNVLADEVLGPRNRLRSVIIALVPGLPTRVLGLHAEFALAGRQSTEHRVDGATVAMWKRILDPARIDPRRVALVVARIALLCGVVLPFVIGRNPEDWRLTGTIAAALFGVWFLVALGRLARERIAGRAGANVGWDAYEQVILAGSLIGVGLGFGARHAGWLVYAAGFTLAATGRIVMRVDHVDAGLRWQALVVMLVNTLVLLLVNEVALPKGAMDTNEAIFMGIGAGALLVLAHDRLLAWWRNVTPEDARAEGKLGWVIAAQVVAMFVLGALLG
jgi:hypothetical protein